MGGVLDPLGQGCGEAEGAVYRWRGEVALFLQGLFEYPFGGCCGGDVPLVGCGLETAGQFLVETDFHVGHRSA